MNTFRVVSLCVSLLLHVICLLILTLHLEFSSPIPVVVNTAKQDMISAVILGDSPKSNILPEKKAPAPIQTKVATPLKETISKKVMPPEKLLEKNLSIKKDPVVDAIALKAAEKKQQREKAKKEQAMLAKKLLEDIKHERKIKQQEKHQALKKQFEKTLQEQAEMSLREQLLEEDIKLSAKERHQSQGVINKYKALILQAISNHWLVPTGTNRKLSCELMIRIAPGGRVLNVQVTRSSGDISLDRSARAAVLKASPLPVPKEAVDFAVFREFVLKVKPETIGAAAV